MSKCERRSECTVRGVKEAYIDCNVDLHVPVGLLGVHGVRKCEYPSVHRSLLWAHERMQMPF